MRIRTFLNGGKEIRYRGPFLSNKKAPFAQEGEIIAVPPLFSSGLTAGGLCEYVRFSGDTPVL